MKSLLLTASIVMLVVTSEHAFAQSAVVPRGHEVFSDRLLASDPVTTPKVAWTDLHRYHGGPKSND
jgi:hypothetical protein